MSDEKSALKGELMGPINATPSNQLDSPQHPVSSGFERLRLYGHRKVMEQHVAIARTCNDLADEVVRQNEIELEIQVAKSKLTHVDTLAEIARNEIETQLEAVQKRKQELQTDRQLHGLEAEARLEKLHASIARSKAEAHHWRSKQNSAPEETKAAKLVKAQAELDQLLASRAVAVEAAGGQLDEEQDRSFSRRIGRLENRIEEITETTETNPFEE